MRRLQNVPLAYFRVALRQRDEFRDRLHDTRSALDLARAQLTRLEDERDYWRGAALAAIETDFAQRANAAKTVAQLTAQLKSRATPPLQSVTPPS